MVKVYTECYRKSVRNVGKYEISFVTSDIDFACDIFSNDNKLLEMDFDDNTFIIDKDTFYRYTENNMFDKKNSLSNPSEKTIEKLLNKGVSAYTLPINDSYLYCIVNQQLLVNPKRVKYNKRNGKISYISNTSLKKRFKQFLTSIFK